MHPLINFGLMEDYPRTDRSILLLYIALTGVSETRPCGPLWLHGPRLRRSTVAGSRIVLASRRVASRWPAVVELMNSRLPGARCAVARRADASSGRSP
jgi:hypothetical protein